MPMSSIACMEPGVFTAHEDHVFLEDFAGAVAGAGDVGGDFLRGQVAVHVRPHGVRVGDHFAVDGRFAASARYQSDGVKAKDGPLMSEANTMPS
jgi:hypothetical protein